MPDFDWLAFLKARRIPYVTAGHTRNNVGVHCEFCGTADQGFHMGIHLGGKGWNCWRSRAHRGRQPHRLIQALLGCSYFEAQRIVGDGPSFNLVDDASFGSYIEKLVSGQLEERKDPQPIKMPREIRRLHNCSEGVARLFLRYLEEERGYSARAAEEICDLYNLRYALKGPYAYRVIFPVEMLEGIVSWTGRAIQKHVEPRYKSLSEKADRQPEGYPTALYSIKQCLWNFQDLVEDPGKILVLCEGPMDALRVDYLGYELGIRATCLFGKSISEEQIYLLDDIAPMYDQRCLMLDPDASFDVLPTIDKLRFIGFDPLRLPKHIEDPAEIRRRELAELFALK